MRAAQAAADLTVPVDELGTAATRDPHDKQTNGRTTGGETHGSVSEAPPVRLVSIEKAAHLLGIGRTTVYDLINRGEVRSTKIGRRTLLSVEDINAFVDRKLASA
jgi:excisionase family DNA binding protein